MTITDYQIETQSPVGPRVLTYYDPAAVVDGVIEIDEVDAALVDAGWSADWSSAVACGDGNYVGVACQSAPLTRIAITADAE